MRVSASGISSLFNGVSFTRTLAEPVEQKPMNDFLVNTIFPHGNVNEHEALRILKHQYPDIHGQSAFARMLDHARDYIPDFSADVSYAQKAGLAHSATFKEAEMLRQLSSYTINGITYDIPRKYKQFGKITLVCQPDGLCNDNHTCVEIKCPYGNMYNNNQSEKWLKYLVQVAIEMAVFETTHAILMIYLAPRMLSRGYQHRDAAAKKIIFNRDQLQPLIENIQELINIMSEHGQGDDVYHIYKSCEQQAQTTFDTIQRQLQNMQIAFDNIPVVPRTHQAVEQVDVVFIGDKNARLMPGIEYELVHDSENKYDKEAVGVVPTGTSWPPIGVRCYVTKASKGQWLLPVLSKIKSCIAVAPKKLRLIFQDEQAASAASASGHKRKKPPRLLNELRLKY